MKTNSTEYFQNFSKAIHDYYEIAKDGTHVAPTSYFKGKVPNASDIITCLFEDGIIEAFGKPQSPKYMVRWFSNIPPDPIFCRSIMQKTLERVGKSSKKHQEKMKFKNNVSHYEDGFSCKKGPKINDKQHPIPFTALKVIPPNNLEARFDSFEDSLKILLEILNKIYADIVNHKIQNFQQSKFDEKFNLLNDKIETLLKQTAPAPMLVKMRKRNIWKSFLKFLFSIRFRMPIVLRSPFVKR